MSSEGLRSPFAGKAGAIKPGVKEDSFKFDCVCNEFKIESMFWPGRGLKPNLMLAQSAMILGLIPPAIRPRLKANPFKGPMASLSNERAAFNA